MKNYVEIETPTSGKIIQYEENGVLYSIPKDLANSDYQAYLKWLENPNAPTAFPHQPLVEG
jgi:hypothetical protein